ncbi:unnamed protein product [Adineta ricciae]|uniref:Uncharacterized protein n=1 Tax=Adineta ricciae TaxID=249248 RepID=A0A813W051_ADIRI|nr:unnamed protein product [Adineta ricciae]CAF0998291.1 unnamed protein product [Adineta ricciae]
MQSYTLVCLILVIALTEGLFFSSKPKCPIKQYKSSKYIVGDKLLVHEDFYERVKSLEDVAKDCKVRIYVKGSYYQLPNPSQQVLVSDADLVIGHGFQFEVRNENNALLCNKICLSKTPTDMAEVKCLLQGVVNRGLTWSRYYPDVISDGTYASNTYGYQTLKTDIQTRCEKEKFKRQLLRALRQMYEEDEQDSNDQDGDDEKKK